MARGRELAAEAAAQLEGLAEQTATATFECSLAQLWLCLAATEARLLNLDAAAVSLERARSLGWLDLPWLRTDPELRLLHHLPAYLAFVDELASAPEVEIPTPAALRAAPQSASGTA